MTLGELKEHLSGLQREVSRTKARIAAMEGRPAEARFESILSGDEDGDINEAYLNLRAEQYVVRGEHYAHERDDERPQIEARADQMRSELSR